MIDSFQYFGGSLAGYFLGALLDKSWGNYFYFMAPFGIIGGAAHADDLRPHEPEQDAHKAQLSLVSVASANNDNCSLGRRKAGGR